MRKALVKVVDAIKKKTEQAITPAPQFIATMGDVNETVLTGTDGIIYVTFDNGQTIEVLNRRLPNRAGIRVLIGISDDMPGVLQVLSEIGVFVKSDGSPMVADHGPTHDYGGGDTTFISAPQFKPFLVLPSSGFVVQLFGGVFQKDDGSYGVVENQTIDLSGDQPATGALYALIEFDDTGTVIVTAGSTQASKELLTFSDIPAITNRALCAIRLYAGQSEVQRNPNGINDFIDLRFMLAVSQRALDADAIDGYPVNLRCPYTVNDGDVLLFDGCTQEWYPAATVWEAINALMVDGIAVDNTPAPTDGQVLTYDVHTDTYRPEDSQGGGGGAGTPIFQRTLAANLTLDDGECMVITQYMEVGAYTVTLDGDADLEIL